jgi:hypothetical protein
MFEEQKARVETARARYREIVNTAPAAEGNAASNEVKDALAELAAAIVDGAAPCSGPCGGATPHGLEQPYKLKGQTKIGFEIGCTVCVDHRAFGTTHAEAIENWNAQEYINNAKAQAHVDAVEAKRAAEAQAAAEAEAKAEQSAS